MSDHRAKNCPDKWPTQVPAGQSFASVTAGPKPQSPRSLLAITPAEPRSLVGPTIPQPTVTDVPSTSGTQPLIPTTQVTSDVREPVAVEASSVALPESPKVTSRELSSPKQKRARTISPGISNPTIPPVPSQSQSPPKSTQSTTESPQTVVLDSPLLGLDRPRDIVEEPTGESVEVPSVEPSAPAKEKSVDDSSIDQVSQSATDMPVCPTPTLQVTRCRRLKPKPSTDQAPLRKPTRPSRVHSSKQRHASRVTHSNMFDPLLDEAGASEEEVPFRVTESGNITAKTPPPIKRIPNPTFLVSGSESQC